LERKKNGLDKKMTNAMQSNQHVDIIKKFAS